MKTYKLNSNLLKFIDVAMYGTFLEPEEILRTDIIEEDKEEGYVNYSENEYWDNFDNEAYKRHVQKNAKYLYDGEYTFAAIKIILELGEIYSPKFYNFANDCIDIDVSFHKSSLYSFISSNRESFQEYIKENYSSFDGFYSFTSSNFMDWAKGYSEDNDQDIASALCFLVEFCQDDEIIPTYEQFLEEVQINTSYSEFYTNN